MPGESFTYDCSCDILPGTTPPSTTLYVSSLNSLVGHVTLAGTGSTQITSSGNIITIGLTAAAGLGSVTSVAATSSNTNLVIGGSPVTTSGTITFALAGALNSISGLVTAADKMIYTTALDTYAVADLTSFARTLLDDASAAAARTTLGLVIGTNVQAWSTQLDSWSANSSWSGATVTLGDKQVSITESGVGVIDLLAITASDGSFAGNLINLSNSSTADFFRVDGNTCDLTLSGAITASDTISGPGSGLTALNGSNISTGTVAVTRGGTGLGSYAVGDLIYADTTTTLAKLADVSLASYLRSGGVGSPPVWSTLKLPNSATVGDILYSSVTNQIANLADVATGNVLRSGGVGVAPAYGKVTSSHVDSTIPTIAAGVNANITSFSSGITFTGDIEVVGELICSGAFIDGSASSGSLNYLLTSTGTGTLWSTQISLDTITINTRMSVEGTITPGGTTGAQTINKPSGTVNFAAAASSVVVTNSLCTTADRVLATVVTNDTTMKSVSCVTTTGSFTLTANAAATAETAVYWMLIRVS